MSLSYFICGAFTYCMDFRALYAYILILNFLCALSKVHIFTVFKPAYKFFHYLFPFNWSKTNTQHETGFNIGRTHAGVFV